MKNNSYQISLKKFTTKELGELCEIVGGVSAPQSLEPFENGTVPFIRMKDLGKYHLTKNLIETSSKLNKDYCLKNKLRVLPKGTIIFPRSGSVHLNHRAILGTESIIVSHIGGLIIKTNNLLPEFLYWMLVQYDMKKIMNQTTGLNMVKLSDISKIEIPVPSIEEQRTIIGKFDKIEETIQLRMKSNNLIENLIFSFYDKLFGNPFYNEKQFDEINLGEASELNMGGTPSTKKREYWEGGDINWIKSGEIKGDFIYSSKNKITSLGLKNSNAKNYSAGDVVMALNGQGKTRGKTSILKIKTTSNQSIASISPNKDKLLPEYLHFHLKQRYDELRNITGDNQRSGLNLKILRDFKIVLPPLELQMKFSNFIKKIEEIKKLQNSSNILFEPTKEILLEKSLEN